MPAGSDVVIVEVALPPQQTMLFQALLGGESGLAVMRCRDPQGQRQQLWTTASQLTSLYEWLDTLPESLKPVVLCECLWQDRQHG
ncbi:MAG: DUF4911 domain-containing protein [Mariprofundaceae bacterium]|nr:DUF4911 domain-containing protein [Mariprofundaceae bacterium]